LERLKRLVSAPWNQALTAHDSVGVFGRGLERPAGRADADAQFPGDKLPRSAGGSEAGYLARVDGDWWITGSIGVSGE
jgi:hypothetical protein